MSTLGAMRKKEKGKGGRKPTYGAATRLARLILGLGTRPWGWSFEAITAELAITERTLLRYVHVCSRELVDRNGKPLLEVSRRGERRILRLAEPARAPDSSVWETAVLYFLLEHAAFLRRTALHECAETYLGRGWKGLSARQKERLGNLDRKLHSVSEASPRYGEHDEQLDLVFRALIDQHPLRLDLAANDGNTPGTLELDPYTLLDVRDRLVLAGRDRRSGELALVPIDAVRRAAVVARPDGKAERFSYPRDYHPSSVAASALAPRAASPLPPDPSPPPSAGAPAIDTHAFRLTRRGPRRASGTPRNKRSRSLFGKAG